MVERCVFDVLELCFGMVLCRTLEACLEEKGFEFLLVLGVKVREKVFLSCWIAFGLKWIEKVE